MKKISLILLVCATIGVGIFFGVRRFGSSEKVVTISVSNLMEKKNNTDEQVQNEIVAKQEIAMIDQSKGTENVPITATSSANVDTSVSVVPDKSYVTEKAAVEKRTSAGKIVQKLVSWGFTKSSGRTIKAIIVHTSYNNLGGDVFDFDKVIQEWKDAGVSPHYAIDRDGTIYQLVADQNVAWHAGASKLPDGTTDVNSASIGVEVINSKDAKFTEQQYGALNSLIDGLKKKYEIRYVLGHDEIAPGRKSDPWNIDWKKVNR